jgi:hypothetical protein
LHAVQSFINLALHHFWLVVVREGFQDWRVSILYPLHYFQNKPTISIRRIDNKRSNYNEEAIKASHQDGRFCREHRRKESQ